MDKQRFDKINHELDKLIQDKTPYKVIDEQFETMEEHALATFDECRDSILLKKVESKRWDEPKWIVEGINYTFRDKMKDYGIDHTLPQFKDTPEEAIQKYFEDNIEESPEGVKADFMACLNNEDYMTYFEDNEYAEMYKEIGSRILGIDIK